MASKTMVNKRILLFANWIMGYTFLKNNVIMGVLGIIKAIFITLTQKTKNCTYFHA